MKKLILFCFFFSGLICKAQIPSPTLNIGITSHNEMTLTEPYNTYTFYVQTRDTLKKIIDVINAKGAKYNLQTNQKFVLGCLQHEMAATTATDIMEYAYKLGGVPFGNVVEIDPRYKTQTPTYTYNIADVAHLIDSTGAQSSNNLGGFVYIPYPGDWIAFTTPTTGVFGSSWKVDILWGAGTGSPLPLHSKDANNYGTWKPRGNVDSIDFYCHDPSKNYWLQGNGCAWNVDQSTNIQTVIAEIRSEATKIKNGTYPANKFYNASVMFNFKDFQSPGLRAKLTTLMDSVNVLVAQGKVNWKTISQKQAAFAAWSATTGISYSQWRCGQTVTLAPTCAPTGLNEYQTFGNSFLKLAPNPASNNLLISWEGQLNENTRLLIYDGLGRKVFEEPMEVSLKQISLLQFNSGIYTVIMQNDAAQSRAEKLIINH
ncbi:MAG: T9SS type A sorting domain-containing protein [Sphingobacteriaceae bacterium]|nr:T9SS type A sorting domain-containing protein [Sphingobacteriaceae bacterium]